MKSTTTTPTDNFYACLMNNDEDTHNSTNHRTSPTNIANSAHSGETPTPPTGYALSDLGASDSAHVINKTIATTPLAVTLPDRTTIISMHTCNIGMPWLSSSVAHAHIIPGLSHSSLISTKKFCDNGFTVSFDKTQYAIFNKQFAACSMDRTTTAHNFGSYLCALE